MNTESPLPRPARTLGTVFRIVLAAVALLAIAAAAWIGVRGFLAYGHLQSAQRTAADARTALADPAAAAGLAADLSADTAAARALTSDPIWAAASGLPWIGPQLAAVSTVTAALDDVASTALPPLADVAAGFSVDALHPVDGVIDTAPFAHVEPAARAAATGLSEAADDVAGIESSPLLPPVAKAVEQAQELLSSTRDTADALARATTLLPPMLGADGPRDYLIVFQNNAEWRSFGGIAGAMALVHTENGRMELVDQGSSSDFAAWPQPVLPLDPDITAIYGDRPARYVQNATEIADFAVDGEIAREMWRQVKGTEVDGVIAVDPVALSYLLTATGPITLPTGDQLTADNAVSLLLNEAYRRYPDPRAQDAFFASAAAQIFSTVAGGQGDPAALVAALTRAGDEHRLLLWSAIAEDQAVLADTTLAGPLPVTDADQLGFGVYLNDGTGSKMSYYAGADVSLGWDTCAADADGTTGDLTLRVTISNNAPADAATSLPAYITGDGNYGVPPGSAKTVGYVYLPPGVELRAAEMSDGTGFGGGFHGDRQVMSFATTLAPGASATATLTVRADTPGADRAVAWVTPGVHPDVSSVIAAACEVP